MSFRYMNTWYPEFTKWGVLKTSPTGEKGLLPSFTVPLNNVKLNPNDMYCKFDLFIGDLNILNYAVCSARLLENLCGRLRIRYDGLFFEYYYDNRDDAPGAREWLSIPETALTTGFNTILFHVSRTERIFEIQANDFKESRNMTVEPTQDKWQKVIDYYVDLRLEEWGPFSFNIYTEADEDEDEEPDLLVSNIIISDEPIDIAEEVISLPVASTDTDMTNNGDGTYTATVEDQYILQSVDLDKIILEHSGKSEVTGIAIAAKPAYKVSAGLNSLIAIEKSDDAISEYDSATLPSSNNSYVMIDKKITSMTINDFRNKQYGFKAGV